MGRKIYSAIEKFNRVELKLREAGKKVVEAKDEIDKALAAKRTKQEIELLQGIHSECIRLRAELGVVLNKLYDGVTGASAS